MSTILSVTISPSLNPTPPHALDKSETHGLLNAILTENVPAYIFLPILLVVIVCACICCFIYLKRANAKISAVSFNSGDESDASSKDNEPTIQKLASPRSHTNDTITTSPSFFAKVKRISPTNNTEAVSLSSTMYGPDGVIVPQTKHKENSNKAYMQHSPSSTIFIKVQSPKEVRKPEDRRRSSNRLEVRNSTIRQPFDSPQFLMATIPSKNSMDGVLLDGNKSCVEDEHSILAMAGSYYVKTYADEGQDCELHDGEISRVITDDLMDVDDEKEVKEVKDLEDKEVTIQYDNIETVDGNTVGGDIEIRIDSTKLRLESDEFIVRSNSAIERETKR